MGAVLEERSRRSLMVLLPLWRYINFVLLLLLLLLLLLQRGLRTPEVFGLGKGV